MSDVDGNLISGTQAIIDLSKKHFEKLLNNTRVVKRNDMYEKIIYETVQPEILEPSLDEIKDHQLPEKQQITKGRQY